MALSYFINRKKTTCVITFQGSLSLNDSEVLDACLKEATAQPARYFVLNMAGLRDVASEASRPFTLFQQGLRAGSKLYLCDVNSGPLSLFKAEGVIRESEVFPDLLSALQAILGAEKG